MQTRQDEAFIPGSKNSVVSSEPMNVAIFQRQCHHSLALAVLHYKIGSEILDEVVRVVLQRLSTQRDGHNLQRSY